METDNWFGFMRSWKSKSTKVFIQNARLLMALEQKYPARQSAAFIERVEQSSKRGQRHLRGWEENSCSYTGPRDVCLSLMLSWASQQWGISKERTPAATVGRTLTQVMPVKKAIATRVSWQLQPSSLSSFILRHQKQWPWPQSRELFFFLVLDQLQVVGCSK